MATTTQKQEEEAAEFAQQFDAAEVPKTEPSEDEVFGLTEPAGEPAAEAAAEPAGEPAGEPAADPAPEPAAEPVESDAEKALKEREAAIAAREAELDAREAAMATSSVERTETVDGAPVTPAPAEEPGDLGGGRDYGKELAEDFGEDFVALLTGFIEQIAAKKVGEGLGGVSATVDEVIDHLRNVNQQNHFKAIAAAHEDFMEVVESPDFNAWKASQSPEEQADIQRVVDAGSAEEIIGLLTKFKQSKAGGVDDDALADAEGVRSGSISLPKAPTASDDYARAWNEA